MKKVMNVPVKVVFLLIFLNSSKVITSIYERGGSYMKNNVYKGYPRSWVFSYKIIKLQIQKVLKPILRF